MFAKKLYVNFLLGCIGASLSLSAAAADSLSTGSSQPPSAAKEESEAAQKPKPDVLKPGSWVNVNIAGSEKELAILGPLAAMIQTMLDNAKPRERNFVIQIDSEAAEPPNLVAFSIQDMDVPEEDRTARLFYYAAGKGGQFQQDVRGYMEQSLGLAFPVMPESPNIDKLLAAQEETANVTITVESEPAVENIAEDEAPKNIPAGKAKKDASGT